MDNVFIKGEVEKFVSQNLSNHDGGHDWWHIDRVRRLSLYIAGEEKKGDPVLVEIAALMHDLGDRKFAGEATAAELRGRASAFLQRLGLPEEIVSRIIYINEKISFSSGSKPGEGMWEFMIVQDADRLDAMGAVGIARAFTYGGFRNNPVFDPTGTSSSTIGHFHDKLLRLKDLMNTKTGYRLAGERHRYMEEFLSRFSDEWDVAK